MNFDTRTVIDLISLDNELKEKLQETVDAELLVFESTDIFTDEEFINSITPHLKDYLKVSIKKTIKLLELDFIKKMINLDNIDYKINDYSDVINILDSIKNPISKNIMKDIFTRPDTVGFVYKSKYYMLTNVNEPLVLN